MSVEALINYINYGFSAESNSCIKMCRKYTSFEYNMSRAQKRDYQLNRAGDAARNQDRQQDKYQEIRHAIQRRWQTHRKVSCISVWRCSRQENVHAMSMNQIVMSMVDGAASALGIICWSSAWNPNGDAEGLEERLGGSGGGG